METLSDENIKALSPYFNANDVVIIAPLNWGLGHASRCIPIIQRLNSVCNVIIASDGQALELLKAEFPNIPSYSLPSYNIRYKYPSILKNILFGFPSIISAIYREHSAAKILAKTLGASIILSDNRLGFFSKQTKNYYLTHQLRIMHHYWIFSKIGSWMHRLFISKFDVCFVPDWKGPNALAPLLSKGSQDILVYLGSISRIVFIDGTKTHDILVILSGPEPQRTILQHELLKILNELTQFKILFILGSKLEKITKDIKNHISFIGVAKQDEINTALNSSKLLISRSGYTTLMDIYNLPIKAIFIPTPGQTEQEYLADYHQKNPKYSKLNQNNLKNLEKTIKSLI